MFLCHVTKKFSLPGEKCNKLVVKKRDKVYTERFFNEEINEWETVEVGRGWEIVKEVSVSEKGLEIFESYSPEQKEQFLKKFG